MTRIGQWMFPVISAERSAAYFEAKGIAAGEQADADARCDRCAVPADPFDLEVIAGDEAVCSPCAKALLGDLYEADEDAA